jgi:hypothetical protein
MTESAPGAAWDSGDRFPTLAARDLERTPRTLPAVFSGDWNLVLVAFRRQHQSLVDRWVAWHATATAGRPGFEVWEVPVIGTVWAPARSFIDGGMAQAVRETHARRHTLTVYTNVAKAAYALDITDTGTVTALLVDGSGRIRWRTTGEPDGSLTAEVLALVDGGPSA